MRYVRLGVQARSLLDMAQSLIRWYLGSRERTAKDRERQASAGIERFQEDQDERVTFDPPRPSNYPESISELPKIRVPNMGPKIVGILV